MEQNSEYIDAYFSQLLSDEEVEQFEQRILDDQEFAGEVAFYLSAKQLLKERANEEKKERFRQLRSQNISAVQMPVHMSARRVWLYRVAVAAAVVVCLFFALYLFLNKHASTQQLADTYINDNFKNLDLKMGTGSDSVQDGLRLYNEEKYDSAAFQFESILQRDTENYSAKKYLGIIYLRSGNYDKSLQYFRRLEYYYSRFSNPAILYQALALMKRNQPGDKQTARQLLQRIVDQNLDGKEIAQQWLKKW